MIYQRLRWIRLLSLLFAVLGLPLALRLVPRNAVYGVRTAATLASDAGWYTANFRAGLALVILGIVAAAISTLVDRSATLKPGIKLIVILSAPAIVVFASVLVIAT